MSAEIQPQTPIDTPTQEKKTKEESLAIMRKGYEEEKAKRLDLERRLSDLEQSKPVETKRDEDDYDSSEPYVDHRSLNKRLSKFEENLEKKVEALSEKKARALLDQEKMVGFMKANPDFEKILQDRDLLQKFADKYPDMAEPIMEMPDTFARQKLVYQNIKALNLHKPAVEEPTIQQKIDANRRSPYYQPSGTNGPPYASQSDYSEAGQKGAYAKMQQLIKGRRS